MKKLLIASVAIVALVSGAAMAADLPAPVYKAPPPPPPPPSWTGCYLNAGGGGGIWDSKHNAETYPGLVAVTNSVDSGGQGWLGRAGGGCDYQFRAINWDVVIGAFGDYDLMDLQGVSSGAVFAGSETERSAWAGGARIGVLITPTLLTYANGGYSGTRFGGINGFNQITGLATGLGFGANNYNGWFAGGGTEYALNWVLPGLFWRNEYRYAAYQSADLPLVSLTTGAPFGIAEHNDKSVQTFVTEVVWRFNWPGTVVARY